MFDNRYTFEKHIRSISTSVAQKTDLSGKSFRILKDQDVLLKCFNLLSSLVQSIAPVRSSAADSHYKLTSL